jgi:hypothetical protein
VSLAHSGTLRKLTNSNHKPEKSHLDGCTERCGEKCLLAYSVICNNDKKQICKLLTAVGRWGERKMAILRQSIENKPYASDC